jgi:hypothetical protein
VDSSAALRNDNQKNGNGKNDGGSGFGLFGEAFEEFPEDVVAYPCLQ